MVERIYSPKAIDIDGVFVLPGAFELLVLTFCLDLPYKYSDHYHISIMLICHMSSTFVGYFCLIYFTGREEMTRSFAKTYTVSVVE
jgi:hypothetical protein